MTSPAFSLAAVRPGDLGSPSFTRWQPWLCLVVVLAWAGSTAATASPPERSYDFYRPRVTWQTIHEGKLAPGHYAYNHIASVEWFNGKFYCVTDDSAP